MNPFEMRELGKSSVRLTQLGFGSAPLGELFVRVDEPTSAATLNAAWDAGIRYYDTAPYYGGVWPKFVAAVFLTRSRDPNSFSPPKLDAGSSHRPSRRSSNLSPGQAACVSITCMTTATTASCGPMSSPRCGSA
jgi:hypothetical protein